MPKYEKPIAISNEDFAENVFMASGGVSADGSSSTDCWTVGGRSVQDWNGSHNVFEMSAKHSTSVTHITTKVVFTYTFSNTITDAYSEGGNGVEFSGNTVTVTRNLHANGYYSGDGVTFKVWAKSIDEASTKALALTGITYVCRHETNVQGGND